LFGGGGGEGWVVGDEDLEDGAVGWAGLGGAAAEMNEAAMLDDDFVADPESEAGSGDFLGGEEGFEGAFTDFAIHAGTGVSDGEADAGFGGIFPIVRWVGSDEEATAGGSVDGVADEVGEDLAEFAGEAEEVSGGVITAFDLDAGVVEADAVKAQHGVKQFGDVGAGGKGGLAVEAEGLLGDFRDALGFVFGHGDVVEGWVFEVAVVAEHEEQVGDGFKGVIDFVGDGGGEAAGGGELFSLAECFFASLAVAGVEDDDTDPADLLGVGSDGVSAGEPGPGASGFAGLLS